MRLTNVSVLAVCLMGMSFVGCGGVEQEEGTESPTPTEPVSASIPETSEDEFSSVEQGLYRKGVSRCPEHTFKFAECYAIRRDAVFGCKVRSTGRYYAVYVRECIGCQDRGTYVTCWDP